MRWCVFLFLVGCGGGANPCDFEGISNGSLKGTVDGQAWTAENVAWSEAGDALQITTDDSGGYRLTLALSADEDGNNVLDAVDAEELPVEVPLSETSGSFALLYPQGATSSLTTDGASGGGVTVAETDGPAIGMCFAFQVTGDGGTSEVEGTAVALPL